MMTEEHTYKKRCPAMIDAGIDDPESEEGKTFCTESCPYERCIVFEHLAEENPANVRKKIRAAEAKRLEKLGKLNEEIASILRVSVRTVERYLEK